MTLPTPAPAGSDVVARVLHPIALDEFFSDYYEKQPCVIHRQDPAYWGDLLSFADIDTVLGSLSLRQGAIRIRKHGGESLKKDLYTFDGGHKVDPVAAARLFEDGYTMIFNALHERLPNLRRYCAALGQYFSAHIQTNIYVTPPRSQGFSAHWDTHDVFILQIEGRKRWRFYDTKIELPLQGQGYRTDDPQRQAGDVSREFILEPGDSLYIPRGLMHAAETMDSHALHITTGLMCENWAKLLLGVVSKVAEQQVALRRNVTVGFARPDVPKERRNADLRAVIDTLMAEIDYEEVFEELADRVVTRHRPILDDLLRQSSSLDAVTIDTELRKRPDALYRIVQTDEQVVVKAYGNEIAFPAFASALVRAALAEDRFVVRDLPDDLDDAGKLVLVRRLVREGLLTRSLD